MPMRSDGADFSRRVCDLSVEIYCIIIEGKQSDRLPFQFRKGEAAALRE